MAGDEADGLNVYNPRNEKIGDINEMIVGRDGRIAAVVVGVGGFLGIGEHNAAMPFDQVQWVDEPVNRTVSGGPGANIRQTGTSTRHRRPRPDPRRRRNRRADGCDGHAGRSATGTAVTTTTTERPVERPPRRTDATRARRIAAIPTTPSSI